MARPKATTTALTVGYLGGELAVTEGTTSIEVVITDGVTKVAGVVRFTDQAGGDVEFPIAAGQGYFRTFDSPLRAGQLTINVKAAAGTPNAEILES